MIIVWYVLDVALRILLFAHFGRFIVMAIRQSNPSWRPKGLVLVLAEISLTLTDPLVKLIDRFVKPVKFGAVQLDLSWTIVILLITFAQALVGSQIP